MLLPEQSNLVTIPFYFIALVFVVVLARYMVCVSILTTQSIKEAQSDPMHDYSVRWLLPATHLRWVIMSTSEVTADKPNRFIFGLFQAAYIILSTGLFFIYGVSEHSVILWVTLSLCSLSALIDAQTYILLDDLAYPALWVMLASAAFGYGGITAGDAIIGASVGYLVPYALNGLYELARASSIGMGHGDFKLLAVFGAIWGWHGAVNVLFLSSVVLLVIVIFSKRKREKHNQPKPHLYPFGPYLACAAWLYGCSPDLFNLIA